MIKLPDNTFIPESRADIELLAVDESEHNYMNYRRKNRPIEVLKKNIYVGKYAEGLVALHFYKAKSKILHGVRILEKLPDNGTDLIVLSNKDNKTHHIQVKSARSKYFSIDSEQLHKLRQYAGDLIVVSMDNEKLHYVPKSSLFHWPLQESRYNNGYYIRL